MQMVVLLGHCLIWAQHWSPQASRQPSRCPYWLPLTPLLLIRLRTAPTQIIPPQSIPVQSMQLFHTIRSHGLIPWCPTSSQLTTQLLRTNALALVSHLQSMVLITPSISGWLRQLHSLIALQHKMKSTLICRTIRDLVLLALTWIGPQEPTNWATTRDTYSTHFSYNLQQLVHKSQKDHSSSPCLAKFKT